MRNKQINQSAQMRNTQINPHAREQMKDAHYLLCAHARNT